MQSNYSCTCVYDMIVEERKSPVAAAAAATCKLSGAKERSERNMNYVDNQNDEDGDDDDVGRGSGGDHDSSNSGSKKERESESECLIWLKLSIQYFSSNFPRMKYVLTVHARHTI